MQSGSSSFLRWRAAEVPACLDYYNCGDLTVASTVSGTESSATNSSTIVYNCQSVWAEWNSSPQFVSTADVSVVGGTGDNSSVWSVWNDGQLSVQGKTLQLRSQISHRAKWQNKIKQRKALKKRRRIRARAETVLRENLERSQVAELREYNYFTLHSNDGKRRYRIRRGRVGNLERVGEDGKLLVKYCVHPAPALPDADTMLAQKLHLEHDDQEFLKIANVQQRCA